MTFRIAFDGHLGAAIDDYRWERDRQEQELESHTMGYAADEQSYKDRGGKMPMTYKDWMKGNGKGPRQMAEEENAPPATRDVYTPDANAWGTDLDKPPAW